MDPQYRHHDGQTFGIRPPNPPADYTPEREWRFTRILSAAIAGFLLIFAIWVGFQ
jgi:hypothetical protein